MGKVFDKALIYAIKAHKQQYRKGDRIPYIVHPLEVASIVATMTKDEEIMAAAVLHDTVEDTEVTIEEIEKKFGSRIRKLVACETEDKHPEIPPEDSWKMRKEESLVFLKDADRDAKIVWMADKLSNMRSFLRMYLLEGDDLWQHFHMKDINQQYWYYQRIAELLEELDEYPAYQEYCKLLSIVFSSVKDKNEGSTNEQ